MSGYRRCCQRVCVAEGLEAGRPPQEAHELTAVAEGEAQKPGRGDLIGVEEAAVRVQEPVGFHPPTHEGGAPGRQEEGPRKPAGDERHAQPQHEEIRFRLRGERAGGREGRVVVRMRGHFGHILDVPHGSAAIHEKHGAAQETQLLDEDAVRRAE